jgi:protein-L-isoaspartate(D-aspartate) O-methyltransferase
MTQFDYKNNSFFFVFLFLCIISVFAQEQSGELQKKRQEMVTEQIIQKGINNEKIINAMLTIPRQRFIPEYIWDKAYNDTPLPTGDGRFLNTPYIVALIAKELDLNGSEKILVISTNDEYLIAVLSLITEIVYVKETKEEYHKKTSQLFNEMLLENIIFGNGHSNLGWEEKAPFDCIIINGAVNQIPEALLNQLNDEGRMILPLGDSNGLQNLILINKKSSTFSIKNLESVMFPPLTFE